MRNKKSNFYKEKIANNWDLFKVTIIALWISAIACLIVSFVIPQISTENLLAIIVCIMGMIILVISGFLLFLSKDASDYLN